MICSLVRCREHCALDLLKTSAVLMSSEPKIRCTRYAPHQLCGEDAVVAVPPTRPTVVHGATIRGFLAVTGDLAGCGGSLVADPATQGDPVLG